MRRSSSFALGCCSVFFIADVHTPLGVTDTFFAHTQATSPFGLIGPRTSRASAAMSIFVAGLLRVSLGKGFFIQRVTLAMPTQKRAATCAMVSPSCSRTDKTLRRNERG